ncbi:MAG: P-II family nitrogen regulator [Planctomycetaceae bacterium]|jgi:nitrogen regulatory protein PII 2|nr:P-II family nitrogen regulator [Planctomycetaceae bacterium]
MKEIMAIIRMDKINKTKDALVAAGISSMHVKDVLGRGKGYTEIRQTENLEKYWEDKIGEHVMVGRLVPKRKISIIVTNRNVPKAVKAIIEANQTGNSGDGKIFVLPIYDTVRVRDGQNGDETLDE